MLTAGPTEPINGPLNVLDCRESMVEMTLDVPTERVEPPNLPDISPASLGHGGTSIKAILDTTTGISEPIIAPPKVSSGTEKVSVAIPNISIDPSRLSSTPKKQVSNGSLDFLGTPSNSEPDIVALESLISGAGDSDSAITTLFWAAINGRIEAVEAVLQYGTGFSIISEVQNRYPRAKCIFRAQQKPKRHHMEFVISSCTCLAIHAGSSPVYAESSTWVTVLHWAVKKHNLPLLRRALEQGASVDQPDYEGYTALHWASWMDDEAATRTLLGYGASVGARDRDGRVPLHDAVERFMDASDAVRNEKYNPPWLIWLLLENEPNRHFKQNNDWGTPLLHLASMFAHKTLVTDLLDPFYVDGAVDVNVQDTCGRTALHLAVKAGREDIVLLLLDKGADLAIKDRDMKTALDYAQKGGGVFTLLTTLEKPGHKPLVGNISGAPIIPNDIGILITGGLALLPSDISTVRV